MTSEVKFAERQSALLQNNTREILPFIQSYKVTPAVASPKEQLYEQTTSVIQPLQGEIYKKPTLIS